MSYFSAIKRDLVCGIGSLFGGGALPLFTPGIGSNEPLQAKKLIVLVHGLKGSRNWHGHTQELSKRGWDVYFPAILNGGDCSVADAATPLASELQAMLNGGAYSRVCLIGASNGTRIVHEVNAMVAWPLGVERRLISIAGFFNGIPWIARGSFSSVLRLTLSKELVDEFESAHPVALEILCPDITLYIAASHDTRFIPNASSIPEGARHFYVAEGEGHISVHHATLPQQLEFLDHELETDFRPARNSE